MSGDKDGDSRRDVSLEPALSAQNVTRTLHEEAIAVPLVRDISLEIFPGEFVAITGPSGSGKSSLLYLLGLLDRPDEGEILLGGQKTSKLGSAALSRLRLEHLGFVFQFHFLLQEFTVLENVMIPMKKLGDLTESEEKKRAMATLERLGLSGQEGKRPGQLSGGQRQRVAIARALANGPKVILADEPTGNLDTKNAATVCSIFQTLAREDGAAIIMVTHDTEMAAQADRRVHLIDGRISTDDRRV